MIKEAAKADFPRYSTGMPREEVLRLTHNLDTKQLIDFWSTFESTVDAVSPYSASGYLSDDLAAVLAGSKPATLVSSSDLERESPYFSALLEYANANGIDHSTSSVVTNNGYLMVIIGRQENVDELTELYDGSGPPGTAKPMDDEFHRSVGKALGYSQEAIDEFVEHYNLYNSIIKAE